MSNKYRDEITNRNARDAAPSGSVTPILFGCLESNLERLQNATFTAQKVARVGDSDNAELEQKSTTELTVNDVGFLPAFMSPLERGRYFAYTKANGFNVFLFAQCPLP